MGKDEKVLIKGNYAIAQAAINAGCQCYFGYPMTPQTEIGEYLSAKMPELGRGFVCAESELAAINMVIGAVSTGVKAMTTSSSCAVALMQEALSYACGDEVPVVLVNVMRAGPGLGYIYPAQGDYNQSVYGGGNGDYVLDAYRHSYYLRNFDDSVCCSVPHVRFACGKAGGGSGRGLFQKHPFAAV